MEPGITMWNMTITQAPAHRGAKRASTPIDTAVGVLDRSVAVGASLPLTAGSAGKVFLAWGPKSLRDQATRRLPAFTDDTPDAKQLARDLATARRRGWAWSGGERQVGVGSVSAPVFDAHGSLVAPVSVSGPASRLRRARPPRVATPRRAAATERR